MPILLLLQSNIHIQSVWYSSDDKVDVLIELHHITHNIGRVEVKGKDWIVVVYILPNTILMLIC